MLKQFENYDGRNKESIKALLKPIREMEIEFPAHLPPFIYTEYNKGVPSLRLLRAYRDDPQFRLKVDTHYTMK